MSNTFGINVEIKGHKTAASRVQAVRNALADRRDLHAQMAVDALAYTVDFIRKNPRHATAQRLGARPTGHREREAGKIQAAHDDTAAILRLRRSSGLGRAFHDLVITPRPGKKYLTIAGHPLTYGKVVRDFPEDTFRFAILHAHRPFPVLLFRETGEVAYWLRKTVTQKQDRTLLPSDAAWRKLAIRSANLYLTNLRTPAKES